MKKNIITKLFIILFFALISIAALAEKNEGIIDIKGGFMGKISFPHMLHGNAVDNCQKCHDMFPKKIGTIQDFKNQKVFKKKHIMTTLCISCHKQKNQSGPTMCNGCHNLIFNFIPSGCCLF